jgi:hypothetical protein
MGETGHGREQEGNLNPIVWYSCMFQVTLNDNMIVKEYTELEDGTLSIFLNTRV